MDWQLITVIVIIVLVLARVVWNVVRRVRSRGRSSCSCGCGGCPLSNECNVRKDSHMKIF